MYRRKNRTPVHAGAIFCLFAAIALFGCGKRESVDAKKTLGSTSQALSSGLVAAYGFEEGTGTTTADSSDNHFTGTLRDPGWDRGKFGNAIHFNGSSSWVTVDDAAPLRLTTGMTLSAWVRRTGDLPTWPTIVMEEQPGEVDYVLYGSSDNGSPSGYVFSGGENNVTGGPSLPLDTWTCLATTYGNS